MYVATSFAVRPDEASNASAGEATSGGNTGLLELQHAEGLDLPSAVPGSGALSLVVGLGHLPAALAAYESVTQAASRCVRLSVRMCEV